MRAGPPFLQPFYDIGKLMIKETCVPAGGSIGLFLLAGLTGLLQVLQGFCVRLRFAQILGSYCLEEGVTAKHASLADRLGLCIGA